LREEEEGQIIYQKEAPFQKSGKASCTRKKKTKLTVKGGAKKSRYNREKDRG